MLSVSVVPSRLLRCQSQSPLEWKHHSTREQRTASGVAGLHDRSRWGSSQHIAGRKPGGSWPQLRVLSRVAELEQMLLRISLIFLQKEMPACLRLGWRKRSRQWAVGHVSGPGGLWQPVLVSLCSKLIPLKADRTRCLRNCVKWCLDRGWDVKEAPKIRDCGGKEAV